MVYPPGVKLPGIFLSAAPVRRGGFFPAKPRFSLGMAYDLLSIPETFAGVWQVLNRVALFPAFYLSYTYEQQTDSFARGRYLGRDFFSVPGGGLFPFFLSQAGIKNRLFPNRVGPDYVGTIRCGYAPRYGGNGSGPLQRGLGQFCQSRD